MPGPAAPSRLTDDPEVLELMRLVNAHRERLGCGTLHWDETLAALAERHSQDMARRRFFSHATPEGATPFDRMTRSGIVYRSAAENLAMGQTSGDQVFRDWMNSRGHRINLESCRYTDLGIGRADGYWTLDLIQRPPPPDPRGHVRQVLHRGRRSTRRTP